MATKVLVLVGTRKGAFILESDAARLVGVRGPFCETWPMNHVIGRPGDRHDLWRRRQRMVRPGGLEVDRSGRELDAFERGSRLRGGRRADQGGLEPGRRPTAASTPASSRPGCSAATMAASPGEHVAGLRDHPSRPHWQPGGGGLILHSLVPHPDDERQIWVGISAAGVFHTADGGETWEPRNRGTRADFLPEGQNYPEFGQCVHCLVMAPGMPDRLYQQNHCGMYRSEDGGRQWESIEAGLPSSFGFPAAAHPRDPDTLYLAAAQRRHRPAATCPTARPRSGARATAATAGRRCARACRSRTRSSACCARPWRPTGWSRPASISAPAPARCSPAPTRATAGPASPQHLPPISSVETLVVDG